MNLRLIFCAFGFHKWYYCCRSSTAGRDTQRECGFCKEIQLRHDDHAKWENWPLREWTITPAE